MTRPDPVNQPLYTVDPTELRDCTAGLWVPNIEGLRNDLEHPLKPGVKISQEDLEEMHDICFRWFFSVDKNSVAQPLNGPDSGPDLIVRPVLLRHLANCLQHFVRRGVALRMTGSTDKPCLPGQAFDDISDRTPEFNRCLSSLVASQVGQWCPGAYRAVVKLYINAGYFGVDDLWVPAWQGSKASANTGASSVRILEKAVSDRNIALACELIEAGAALHLVPAHTCMLTVAKSDGAMGMRQEVVKAGDFTHWVNVTLGENSSMTLQIRQAAMKGVIARQTAANVAGEPIFAQDDASGSSGAAALGLPIRRRHI